MVLLYTKFKQKDSVEIAYRSAVVSYSMHCADLYGDAIYLARIMAQKFTDDDFDQYDGCITPPALPKIANTDISPLPEIKISPNPTLGTLSINFSDRFSGVCKVMDITGNLIMTNAYHNTDQILLDLSANPGMNLIRLTNEDGTSRIFKIIVIK